VRAIDSSACPRVRAWGAEAKHAAIAASAGCYRA